MLNVSRQQHLWSCLIAMAVMFVIFHTCHSATPYFLFVYLLYDFILFYPFFLPDMVVHHVLTMLLLTGYYHYETSETNKLLSMEVSTPFLVLHKLGILKPITKILFLLTFVYFRIYQVGQLAYTHRYETMDIHIWLMYALWLLNWHWMLTIISHFRNQKKIVAILDALVPYTHFFSVLALKQYPFLVQGACLLSAISSFTWHTTKTPCSLTLDRMFLHTWSWIMSVYHTDHSPLTIVSLPFHYGAITTKHHRELTMVSIGWDVFLIFHHQQNLMWLAAWVITGMLYVREVVGYGTTQALVHSSVAWAIYQLCS